MEIKPLIYVTSATVKTDVIYGRVEICSSENINEESKN